MHTCTQLSGHPPLSFGLDCGQDPKSTGPLSIIRCRPVEIAKQSCDRATSQTTTRHTGTKTRTRQATADRSENHVYGQRARARAWTRNVRMLFSETTDTSTRETRATVDVYMHMHTHSTQHTQCALSGSPMLTENHFKIFTYWKCATCARSRPAVLPCAVPCLRIYYADVNVCA